MSESVREDGDVGVGDAAVGDEMREGGASQPDRPAAEAVAGDPDSIPSADAPAGGSVGSPEGSDGEAERRGDVEAQTELKALREQFEGLNDRHLRLVAEFNNFKRRSEQERLGAWARAQAELTGRLVDVLDDLQRVAELDLTNATVEAIMEGIDLVERKFVRTLEDAGIEIIEPNGVPFNPEFMEAMMRVPAEAEEQVDQVAQVFQKGYMLKGNLIRPARVSVYTQS